MRYCFWRYCDKIRHRHWTAIYHFVKIITSTNFLLFYYFFTFFTFM